MLLCALRANSHDVHGLPRFRTNDVLLGTSGVGVHYSRELAQRTVFQQPLSDGRESPTHSPTPD